MEMTVTNLAVMIMVAAAVVVEEAFVAPEMFGGAIATFLGCASDGSASVSGSTH